MERTGLSLKLHQYTDLNVELSRELFNIDKENKWIPLIRPDNKKPYYKSDIKDLGYVIGHITVFIPPLTLALYVAVQIKRRV